MKDPKEFRPGRYQHHRGDLYIAHHLVRHHETNEVFVVYTSCKHGTTSIREWDSPGKDSWCDAIREAMKPFSIGEAGVTLQTVYRYNYVEPAL